MLVENELKKLQTFDDSIYFRGKIHFEEDGTQNYFSQCADAFKRVAGVGTGKYVHLWKSKGLSYENITAPTTSDYSLNQSTIKLCW